MADTKGTLFKKRDEISYEILTDGLKLVQVNAHGEEHIIFVDAEDVDVFSKLLGEIHRDFFTPQGAA